MPTGTAQYDAAVDAASCHMLGVAAGAATQFAVYSLAAGAFIPGAIAGLAAGIGSYAYAKNCLPWDPDDPGASADVVGCREIAAGGLGTLQFRDTPESPWDNYVGSLGEERRCIEIVAIEPDNFGGKTMTLRTDSQTKVFVCSTSATPLRQFRLNPDPGATCGDSSDGKQGKEYTYIDPDTNCELNVTFLAWGATVDNNVGGIWKIEPAPQARAGGGIISQCNFPPVIYYAPPPGGGGGGGGGGGPVWGPWNPDWDLDPDGSPWSDFLRSIVGGAAAAATNKALEELFKTNYPAGSREIHAACENKQDGTPETFSVNYPEEPFNDRVLTALDAIVDFQQQILLWRTPVCTDTPTPQTGDPVSINWVSDEYSPFGNDRIRKLLTYFDQVGSTLEATVAHWKDFTWQAGSVIVSVNGVALGKPQVWASTEAEGKRVINHAAAIAGVDMSSAEWLVTSPRASRYGQTGLMRVHRSKNGTLGITKRSGPSGSPVGLT